MRQEEMSTVGYDETFSDDIRALRQFREKQVKGDSEAIAIFQQDDNWFAFDDDADRLNPKFGINIAGWSSEEDYKADRLSLAQQTIDYVRYSNENKDAIVNLGKYPVHSVEDGIDTINNINFVKFSGHDVNLFTESGSQVNLVTGQMWNVAMAEDYIISTGNMMDAQREDVLHGTAGFLRGSWR